MKTTEKRRHIFGPIAFILAFAMLATSSMPVGASDDETLSTSGIDAQECVPIAEETWVLGLLDGDLPLDQLKSASLSDNDLPYVISRSLADERQHVNRLYEVVSKGETIGLTGSTGWGSGAHLHLIFSASSGNGPNNYIHTFDPLWFYPNIQFSRNDSTDSIIGGIRQ